MRASSGSSPKETRDADRPLRVAEHEDVTLPQLGLAGVGRADVDHNVAAQDARAVRAVMVADDVGLAGEHDGRMLAGDVPLTDHEVVQIGATEPDDLVARLEDTTPLLPFDDLESNHDALLSAEKLNQLPLRAWRRARTAIATLSICVQLERPSSASRRWSISATASGLPWVATQSIA